MPRHSPPFTGIWPAMVTPFDAQDGLNVAAARQLVARFIQQGAGGIYLCGTTGEAPLLAVEERKQLAEAVISEAAGQLPVIVQVGHGSPAAAMELAIHARRIRADAVSSIHPAYYPYRASQLASYWAEISARSDLPFYAYVFQNVGSNYAEIEDWVRGLRKIPTLAGLKFTNVDPYQLALLRVVGEEKLNIFSGSDECYLASVVSGADAAIGSSYNFALPLWMRVKGCCEAGRMADAQRLMLRCAELVGRMNDHRYLTRLKLALRRQGLDCGLPRMPLRATEGISDEETDLVLRLSDA